jgi:tetratricopeptide (TPR) repeat protein
MSRRARPPIWYNKTKSIAKSYRAMLKKDEHTEREKQEMEAIAGALQWIGEQPDGVSKAAAMRGTYIDGKPLYLAAEAEYKMRRYAAAEKKLREILQINRTHPNSFHTANAYSLLGLIYLQKKDLQRAKVLFQQSLHLEQSHRRCEGLAADYANLALIDELTDYADNAASNWQIALEYARETGDAELVALIEKHKAER